MHFFLVDHDTMVGACTGIMDIAAALGKHADVISFKVGAAGRITSANFVSVPTSSPGPRYTPAWGFGELGPIGWSRAWCR